MKLLKFYKAHCQPCNTLNAMFSKLKMPEDLKIIYVNVDDKEGKEMAIKYDLKSVPSLVKEDGSKMVGVPKSIDDLKLFLGIAQ